MLRLDPSPVDLRSLVCRVADGYRGAAAGPAVRVSVDVDANVPRQVMLDPGRVTQILGNLISNACKFTSVGSIEVSVEWAHAMLTLEVRDSGVGIPADALPALFERFTQGTVRGSQAGTGLGLALVQELVTAMDGEISVTTEVGVGTKFCVCLPCGAVAAADGLDQERVGLDRRLDGLTLLLVDDNPVNRMVGDRLVSSRGATCVAVDSGMAALTALAEGRPFDAVLLDVHMPMMSGLEVAAAIRSSELWADLAVIGLSAGQTAERDAAIKAGMDAFVTKPMDLDLACSVIHQVLAERRRKWAS